MKYKHLQFVVLCSTLLLTAGGGFAQSGGTFSVEHSVIAGGGGRSEDAGAAFTLSGSAGQPVAGENTSGGTFSVTGGFWNPTFGPTAAAISVSGRVLNINGTGVKNAVVSVVGGTFTSPRTVKTNDFGNFRFEGLEAGRFYVLRVSHRKYGFAQEEQAVTPFDELTDVVFQAAWEN